MRTTQPCSYFIPIAIMMQDDYIKKYKTSGIRTYVRKASIPLLNGISFHSIDYPKQYMKSPLNRLFQMTTTNEDKQ